MTCVMCSPWKKDGKMETTASLKYFLKKKLRSTNPLIFVLMALSKPNS
jgi:hypothetical protein